MEIKRSGSQPSGKGPVDYFTGTVRIDPLFSAPDPARAVGAHVTFEPGARTAWHTHPLGQTLIVTSGSGLAQRWGGPIEAIRPGDVVWFPPGEKHWHGAAKTTAMTHIAVQERLDGKAVDWMEQVSDEQSMGNNIAGKVVVITGASSGLGDATARQLSSQGAIVVLGARRLDRLQALEKELTAAGGKALSLATDVTRVEDVKRLVEAAVTTFGRIDVMINNAGLMPQSFLDGLKIDEWDRMIDVNIKGVLYGIAAALPHMKQQKSGHFINVSSVAGHKVRPGGTVYSATKHAVRVISEGLRQEVKAHNIRTTVISPGAVDTELPNTITDPVIAAGMRKFYDDMAIPADSFARAVVFAMSQPDDVDVNEILYRPTRQEF